MKIPKFETRPDGYERVRSWEPSEKRERYAYIHQLVLIAEGEDPYLVFSNGRFHGHHGNRVRWDNRPSNLSLERSEDHVRQPGHIQSEGSA